MPRSKRICPAGDVFHVLNRSVARLALFEKPEDYDAFVQVVRETWEIVPLPIFAMVVMPNHWHFVVRPQTDDQLSEFFRRMSLTHTMRWHAHFGTSGTGHLYQGRFKSFPIQSDEHLLTVLRYVERNPVKARLSSEAESWRWSSAWQRSLPKRQREPWLVDPVDPPLPRRWRTWVNTPQTEAEITAVAQSIQRGKPFGSSEWTVENASRWNLEQTLRNRGRPRKET